MFVCCLTSDSRMCRSYCDVMNGTGTQNSIQLFNLKKNKNCTSGSSPIMPEICTRVWNQICLQFICLKTTYQNSLIVLLPDKMHVVFEPIQKLYTTFFNFLCFRIQTAHLFYRLTKNKESK